MWNFIPIKLPNYAKISYEIVKKFWLSSENFGTFLGVGKNFRLLMQLCRFFSPDLFMKISNFSKTVHTIFIKFCSHSTSKWAPACSKASKLFDWNVRNIAKISPKTAIFRLFFDFLKNCPYDSNEIFLKSFYTILESYMCNDIEIVWLGCEKHSQN